jgi:hypothetical protein
MKQPVIITSSYILYLEQDNGFTFIHCDVLNKWTKEVKKQLANSFKDLTIQYGQPLYALHTKEDKKHEKFLKMFDFSYLQSIKGLDGNNYDIYVWR